MNRKVIEGFVSPRTKLKGGGTLAAVHHFFNEALTVAEAAKKAGITKQAANAPIQRAKREALKAGWRRKSIWVGPDEEVIIRKKRQAK